MSGLKMRFVVGHSRETMENCYGRVVNFTMGIVNFIMGYYFSCMILYLYVCSIQIPRFTVYKPMLFLKTNSNYIKTAC